MLKRLDGYCSDGVTCPATWLDEDSGDVIVQGYRDETPNALPPAPDGETRVRIPRSMLVEAAAKLQ